MVLEPWLRGVAARCEWRPTCRALLGASQLIVRSGGAERRVPLCLADVRYVGATDERRAADRAVEAAEMPAEADEVRVASIVAVAPRLGCLALEDALLQADPPLREVWLIVVDGGSAALRLALAALGERGAVRADLRLVYSLAERPLGRGTYASVLCGRLRQPRAECAGSGEPAEVAVKVLDQREAPSCHRVAVSEIYLLLASQGHPNVVGFYGAFLFAPDPDDCSVKGGGGASWAVVLELCPGGSLQQHLHHHGPFDEVAACDCIAGVMSALAHIHGRGIVHRDVKAENVLLGQRGRSVLADFGLAALAADQEAMAKPCGTLGYAAPEVLRNHGYGPKVDVFSAGVVLYQCLSCTLPFAGSDVAEVLRNTRSCEVRFDLLAKQGVGPDTTAFLRQLLTKSPDKRPSAEEAMALSPMSAPPTGGAIARGPMLLGGRRSVPQEGVEEGAKKPAAPQLPARAVAPPRELDMSLGEPGSPPWDLGSPRTDAAMRWAGSQPAPVPPWSPRRASAGGLVAATRAWCRLPCAAGILAPRLLQPLAGRAWSWARMTPIGLPGWAAASWRTELARDASPGGSLSPS